MNQELKKEAELIVHDFHNIVIRTKDEYSAAGDAIKTINYKIKQVEAKRVEYTKPLLDQKKLIDEDFKGIIEPLKKVVANIKAEMLKWMQAEKKRLDEEQKRIEEEAMERAKKEKLAEVEVAVVNDIKKQYGNISTSSVRKEWKWKVVDETKIPREFLVVNSLKINQAVRNGEREIAGLEIYEDEQVVVR